MKRIYILFLPALLSWFAGLAQRDAYIVTGKVTDSLQKGVANASIILLKQSDSGFIKKALSDSNGMFSLSSAGIGGTFILQVTSVGFDPFRQEQILLPAAGAATSFIAVKLSAKAAVLSEVIVRSRKAMVEQKIDMTVLTVPEGLRTEIPNVLELLKIAPGVTVSDNEDQLSMNGKENVDVMINGRLSRMSLRDLLKFLKSIPSSSLLGLEVINNPSSKYEMKGNTGILNIRLKKNAPGMTGNFSSYLHQAIHPGGSNSLILDFGGQKLNLNTYLAYDFGKYRTTLNEDRIVPTNNANQYFHEDYKNEEKWQDPTLRFTADYTVSPRSTFGAIVELEESVNRINYESVNSLLLGPKGQLDSTYASNSRTPYTRHWDNYNLNYQYADTVGSSLNIDLDYSYYDNHKTSVVSNQLVYPVGEDTLSGNDFYTKARMNIYSLRADYTKSFAGRAKIEAGLKFSETNNIDHLTTMAFVGEKSTLDSSQTNGYNYKEYVSAAYLNYGESIGKWGFQGGLRFENTNLKGVFTSIGGPALTKPDSSYSNLLPSFFVTYAPNDNNNFRISAARRIKRPDYEDLEPFTYQTDLFSYTTGNPGLVPQKNTNVELTYAYKNKLNLTAGYVYTTNYFNPLIHEVGDVQYSTTENTGIKKSFSFEAYYPIQVTKWWVSRNKVSVNYNYFNGALLQGYLITDGWGGMINSSQRFNLGKTVLLQLSTWYNMANRDLYYHTEGYGNVSAGISKKIISGRGGLRVGVSDVFHTQQERTEVNFDQLRYTGLRKWESRSVFLEFTYKFGKELSKSVREREKGDADEKDRQKR